MNVDIPKVECSTKEINFKETKMFSSRTFGFQVKNSSCVEVEIETEFLDEYTGSSDAGYFSIQTSETKILPESSKELIVKFSPLECEVSNLRRILILKVKGTNVTIKISLNGEAERPLCHFELPGLSSSCPEKVVEI